MPHVTRPLLLAGAALSLMLSGCASGGQAGANTQQTTAANPQEQTILQYLGNPAEINTALQKVGAQCMHDAGYPNNDGQEARLRPHESISDFTGRFNSAEDAQFRGYPNTLWIASTYPTLSYLSGEEHHAMYGQRPQLDSRNLRIQKYDWGASTASAAFTDVFTDIDTSADPAEYGCKGVAIAKVFGSLENYATYEGLYPDLVKLGSAASAQTRKFYDENRQAYQQCLTDAGITNVGAPPLVAERAVFVAGRAYRGEGVRTNEKEQKLAAADYACDQKLGYFDHLDQLVIEANRTWISQNAGRIEQVQKIQGEATERAQKIVNEQDP